MSPKKLDFEDWVEKLIVDYEKSGQEPKVDNLLWECLLLTREKGEDPAITAAGVTSLLKQANPGIEKMSQYARENTDLYVLLKENSIR